MASSPPDDLFPFTRARLNDVPHGQDGMRDSGYMTSDDLRKQMLSVVFGWNGDIIALIEDEISRHPADSHNALYLSKWLGQEHEILQQAMQESSDLQNDWCLLALGCVNDNFATKRLGELFVERLLSQGDLHAAATILIAMGENSDAIEVYVSRNLYLEAVLLTCLVTPADWQRQSTIVRQWGEFVVQNSQHQLAIRCFSCSGKESSETWVSPTATRFNTPFQADSRKQNATPLSEGRTATATPFTTVRANAGTPFTVSRTASNTPLHELQVLTEMASQDQFDMSNNSDFGDRSQKSHRSRRGTMDSQQSSAVSTVSANCSVPPAPPAPTPPPIRAAQRTGTRITPQTSALKLVTSFGGNGGYKFPGLVTEDHRLGDMGRFCFCFTNRLEFRWCWGSGPSHSRI